MAIIVTLENEDILVDVGFGKFSLEPLPIKMNHALFDQYGQFIFDMYNSTHIRINQMKENRIVPQYIFSPKSRELIEFKERCAYHQQSENSHFTQKKVITIAKENGRVTLNDTQLKILKFGKEKVIEFKEEEFEKRLKELFNIKIKND